VKFVRVRERLLYMTDEANRRGPRGGRGCPDCGSHATKILGKTEQICRDCNHVWTPCAPYCRGYRCDRHHPDGPTVIGCSECGVPTKFARSWPESWRALAKELDGFKFERVA
jgi:hypothetical protein